MAPDESGKTTGDPLRDAIAASSKGASSALEQLRQHLTKRERELLEAKLSAENAWNNRPTEQEFNDDWVTPLEALDVSHHRLADDADKWTIIQELQAGTYRAVARRAQTDPNVLGAEHLVVIHPMAWRRMDTNAEHFFWKTNNLVVSAGRNDIYNHPTGDKERYFDIKFDPASFTGKPLPRPPETTSDDLAVKLEAAEAGWDTLADQLNNPPPQYADDPVGGDEHIESNEDLPSVEFEHLKLWWAAFSAAYPTHGEDFAITSARATFPKHFVRRQWVRDLRGAQPMGRPRKSKDK